VTVTNSRGQPSAQLPPFERERRRDVAFQPASSTVTLGPEPPISIAFHIWPIVCPPGNVHCSRQPVTAAEPLEAYSAPFAIG
jgi:hypothetical protein